MGRKNLPEIVYKYRAIIADDEPKVLQLVKLLGHWEQYGIEIIDECHDGYATLESIKKNRPDFVLSDIKMPDLDGIELIEEARRAGIDSLFILLSGYRHFEYAQSAIALNVVDYLLKPIDEEKLNKTLERVCRQIDQRKEDDAGKQELMKIKEANRQNRRAPLWETILNVVQHQETIEKLNSEELLNQAYDTEFCPGCYQVIQVFTDISGLLDCSNFMMKDETEQLFENCFGQWAVFYYTQIKTGYSVILNYPRVYQKQVRDGIMALYYGIHNLTEIYGEFRINIGVSKIHDTCLELGEAGKEAVAAEWGRLVMTRNGVLHYDMIAHLQKPNENNIINQEELHTLTGCMKYLQLEELGELFGVLYNRSGSYNNCYPGILANVTTRIFHTVVDSVDGDRRDMLRNQCFSAYLSSSSFSSLIKNLYLKLEEYVQMEQRKTKDKIRKPIAEALRYIKENYTLSISAEEVAVASHVSTAYLSKLFKEELHIGFNEFLTQVRLEEAEKLLSETNLSIKEIAGKVGYPDEKYFSKLFRKTTGIKPSEYRRIYG